MTVYLLWAASAVCFITFCVHTFIRGPRVTGRLLASTHVPQASKGLSYYCWHIVSVLLLSMALGYFYAAIHPGRPGLAVFLTALSIRHLVATAASAVAVVPLVGHGLIESRSVDARTARGRESVVLAEGGDSWKLRQRIDAIRRCARGCGESYQ